MLLGKTVHQVPRQLISWLPHKAPLLRCCKANSNRSRGRDGRTGSGGASTSSWLLPTSLVSERPVKDGVQVTNPDAPLTVYTIRFTTGTLRGAAMSDPAAAVQICLVGQDGRGVLHRVSPVNDPLESRAHTVEMCQLIGPDVGADCSIALASAAPPQDGSGPGAASTSGATTTTTSTSGPSGASRGPTSPLDTSSGAGMRSAGGASSSSSGGLLGRPPPPPPPKRRFQEGSVDEVSILVPELGPLAGVLVGVEGGTWYLDELDVASSRTHHLDRFVCRRVLGGPAGEGAAMLAPVPVGAVVYGEGESAVVLSKDQAAALWSLNMSDYSDLKRRIATTTALLVASGASLAALTGGTAAALPFTAGGAVGLVYQWLLMRGVDHVMEAATGHSHSHRQDNQQQQDSSSPSFSAALPSSPASTAGSWGPQSGSGAAGPAAGSGSGSGLSAAASAASASASAPPTLVEVGVRARRQDAAGAGGSGGSGGRILASTPVRLGFVCASAALGLALLSQEEAGLAESVVVSGGPAAAWQLALGALGFLTYKVALVGVSLGESSGGANALAGLGLQQVASGGPGLDKFKRD